MKIAAIIFNWISFASILFSLISVFVTGIIFACFPSVIASMIDSTSSDTDVTSLIAILTIIGILIIVLGCIPLIVGIVICLYTNKKLNTATSKSELLLPAILSLIFTGLITGILMLCISEDDLL